MNFSDMTKEQKQMLVLAVGGLITGIAVVGNLLIGPARQQAAEARTAAAEIESDLQKGERVLRGSARIRREVATRTEALLSLHREHLPPAVSPYIWALEQLTQLKEELDIEITVREHPDQRYIPVPETKDPPDPNSVPMWIPYAVDVKTRTSFANLQKFLDLIRENLPYAAVAEMRVQPSENDPERHEITLLVEWPTFRFGEDLAWLQDMQNGETP